MNNLHQAIPPVIWIAGGPGCGKSTQSRLIAKLYGFYHLSIGNLLRDEVASGSHKSANLASYMNRGDLVPYENILDVVKKDMLKHLPDFSEKYRGFLIDSCPRHKENGILFEKHITPCKLVLYLEASKETMISRTMKRSISMKRADDTSSALEYRLELFEKGIEQALEPYKNKLEKIDAEMSIDEVFAQIVTTMKKHGFNIYNK